MKLYHFSRSAYCTYLTLVEFVHKAKLPVVNETVTTETDLSLLIAVPGLVVSMEMKVDHA